MKTENSASPVATSKKLYKVKPMKVEKLKSRMDGRKNEWLFSFGLPYPVYNKVTKTLLAGHESLRKMSANGFVEVHVVRWTPEQESEFNEMVRSWDEKPETQIDIWEIVKLIK